MNPEILKMMRFIPNGHNQISLDHIECIGDFLEEFCPIDKTKAKRMLRGSMGISLRYVQEYLDSFEAWKIIKYKAGNIEYLLKRDNYTPPIVLEGMHNEDVPSTFPSDIGMLPELPECRYRPKNKAEQCNPSEGVYVSAKKMNDYCKTCKNRIE